MIFYFTFNDLPSGIFSSQVIDVVKFIKSELHKDIKLVSFISIRNFSSNKKKIKNEFPESLVFPMFPGVHRWRKNIFLFNVICWKYKPTLIIARSVLATQIALKTTIQKVIYDGRGAIAEEWKEYQVVTNKKMLDEISELERTAVINTYYRIAVSEQLVNLWKEKYNYSGNKHVVIPCTLNKVFETVSIDQSHILEARQSLGFSNDDIVFVYSGSLAGWQSFNLLSDFIEPLLNSNLKIKLLFLSDKDDKIIKLENIFPTKIVRKKITPAEVPAHLLAADYGLLIREETVTNRVASPVKFAEYLACGLEVLISDNLGDYSEFVNEKNCGYLYHNLKKPGHLSVLQKQNIQLIALRYFTKKSYTKKYETLIS